ncbi:hypothetical protein GM415_15585 [Pseudodesulfovibrio cashew]|uniref:Uncharacterized protein n=1 Tax=Pseudodesulfovibrio cashew TaxID=2678688 RepID=A0A6I6JKI0_9BACT|nr:hypothetical protein [Pseudodesulfovibrio cashew]QGY41478.1 hypothetical protein GM415_15585 [Pseudodesulfovibrio cashew]
MIYLNYAALGAVRLSSDGLGPVDSIAHPLKAGRYHGTVWLNDEIEGTFILNIEAEGDGDQVDIDLASIGKVGKAILKQGPPVFSGGCLKDAPVYAMFHCEEERTGYRVLLAKVGEDKSEFDSKALSKGDYYILTPLKPGSWKITTSAGKEGSLIVEEAKPTAKARASQHGATIVTDGKTIKPARTKIVSGDGVVFEITGKKVAIEVALAQSGRPSGQIRPKVRIPGRIKRP